MLFAPRAVALVGASGDAAKNTARPERYLRKHGYAGRIFPVNPSRKDCFATVSDIPEPVDHAFIMIQDVETALEDCAKRGVPVVSIYSDGFADAGEKGAQRQARLVERARTLGIRLLGPNSMGVIDVAGRVALTVNAVVEMDALPSGGAIVTDNTAGAVASFDLVEGTGLFAGPTARISSSSIAAAVSGTAVSAYAESPTGAILGVADAFTVTNEQDLHAGVVIC